MIVTPLISIGLTHDILQSRSFSAPSSNKTLAPDFWDLFLWVTNLYLQNGFRMKSLPLLLTGESVNDQSTKRNSNLILSLHLFGLHVHAFDVTESLQAILHPTMYRSAFRIYPFIYSSSFDLQRYQWDVETSSVQPVSIKIDQSQAPLPRDLIKENISDSILKRDWTEWSCSLIGKLSGRDFLNWLDRSL